ncbi:MAG: hypothetical protein IPF56_05470 [Chloroflexi bacterium]|nr:hypothetical protein [Chloroflexota bacterium]
MGQFFFHPSCRQHPFILPCATSHFAPTPPILPAPANRLQIGCTSHFAPCTSHFALCTSHFVPCTSHFALCTSHFAPCTSHFALCTSHFAPCTSHFAPCTSHFILIPTGTAVTHRQSSIVNRQLSIGY